jgi:aspartate beta-hydroxylase
LPSNQHNHYKHSLISALAPGTHITPHNGPTNKKLRVHIPIVVPDSGCSLRCAGETQEIKEGKVIIFDDSFEHEAFNNSDKVTPPSLPLSIRLSRSFPLALRC